MYELALSIVYMLGVTPTLPFLRYKHRQCT